MNKEPNLNAKQNNFVDGLTIINDLFNYKPINEKKILVYHLKDYSAFLKSYKSLFENDFKYNEEQYWFIYNKIRDLSEREILQYIIDYLKNTNIYNSYTSASIPNALSHFLLKNINLSQKEVLICDAEKFSIELYDIVNSNTNTHFYLTIKNEVIRNIYSKLFTSKNVTIQDLNIYEDGFNDKKYDLILCFPIMGGRDLYNNTTFISREPCFIATENLLLHLTISGELVIVLPAKIGFGRGKVKTLRDYIQDYYRVEEIAALPSGALYPYTGISTYCLTISNGTTDSICFKKYDKKGEALIESDNKLVFYDELKNMDSWNADYILAYQDEDLLNYQSIEVKKSRLEEVAEVFRGKAVTNKDEDGNIGVINISNINEFGIDYEEIDLTKEDERKITRYILQDGDVLVTTRGFTIKIAVFEKQSNICIASSNLCVIRPNSKILIGDYLKLFLESETGNKLLKSLQRGTAIVNINYNDICQLEVPTPSIDEQKQVVDEYNTGLKLYKETVTAAEEAWKKIKTEVQKKLY